MPFIFNSIEFYFYRAFNNRHWFKATLPKSEATEEKVSQMTHGNLDRSQAQGEPTLSCVTLNSKIIKAFQYTGVMVKRQTIVCVLKSCCMEQQDNLMIAAAALRYRSTVQMRLLKVKGYSYKIFQLFYPWLLPHTVCVNQASCILLIKHIIFTKGRSHEEHKLWVFIYLSLLYIYIWFFLK